MTVIWDLLRDRLEQPTDDLLVPEEPDVRSAIYPKKVHVSRAVNPLDLPKLSTRTLMHYLEWARLHGAYFPFGYDGSGPSVSFEAIKVELAKRPHVPNKVEAKVLRRQKATQHRGRAPRPKKLPTEK